MSVSHIGQIEVAYGVRWYGPLLFLRPAARWPGDLESVLPSADPGHMKLKEKYGR